MAIVPFDSLPDHARLWVFASDKPLSGAVADTLLASVDRFLAQWKAHGIPLRSGRELRDDRFIAVAVDVDAENASGCSIDGLFRELQQLEHTIGSRLVGGGRVFYRANGAIDTTTREDFVERVKRGEIDRGISTFDLGLTTASEWRSRFEQPATASWAARYFSPA